MENINTEDFNTFKLNVKKYITYDDDIKKIETLLKEKKREKKEITNNILTFMTDYNIEDLNTQTGKLKKSISFTKKPLNKNTIKEKLSQYFNNDLKGNEATLFILNNIEKEKKIRLKRIDKK
uniref:Uncharacterized protein n=1 Tax=viral metagenome TaxID=1070528 RepID=A0A6C0J1C2_9ZZZZ